MYSAIFSSRQVFPTVNIQGYSYQVKDWNSHQLNYSINGIGYHCDRCEYVTSEWRYLSESSAEMYDVLGQMLANS